MENKIRTYTEKPQCEVPSCTNDGYILLANRWICGNCFMKWDREQKKKEQEANDIIFNDIVRMNKK